MMAFATEYAPSVAAHADARAADGRRLIVRNGHALPRTVTCDTRTMQVRTH